jgi:hypothetical protein
MQPAASAIPLCSPLLTKPNTLQVVRGRCSHGFGPWVLVDVQCAHATSWVALEEACLLDRVC